MSSLINRHASTRHWTHPSSGSARPAAALVVVEGIGDVVDGPLDYAAALRPSKCLAVHVRRSRRDAASISRVWAAFHPTIPLGVVDPGLRSTAEALEPVIDHQQPTAEHPVIVLVPDDLRGDGELTVGGGAVNLAAAFADRDEILVLSVSSNRRF